MSNHIIEMPFYVIFERRTPKRYDSSPLGLRATLKRPTLGPDEISVRITAKVDRRLFTKPNIEGTLVIDERHVQRPEIPLEVEDADGSVS